MKIMVETTFNILTTLMTSEKWDGFRYKTVGVGGSHDGRDTQQICVRGGNGQIWSRPSSRPPRLSLIRVTHDS